MLIKFNSTSVELASGEMLVVNGEVSCERGDKILLTGLNGAGKSTMLMLLRSAASHRSLGGRQESCGHIHDLDWDSINVTGTEFFTVAHVFQEPRQNFICKASSDEIMLPLLHESMIAEETINWLSDLIDAADVYGKNLWRRRIDNLSSGEQQRIAVAAALAPKPNLLLWDEALARVDDRSAQALITLLERTFANGILIAATHRAPRYRRLFSDKITSKIVVSREAQRITILQDRPVAWSDGHNELTEINFAKRTLWKQYIGQPDVVVSLFNNGMRLFSSKENPLIELKDLEFHTTGSEDPLALLKSGNIGKGLTFVVGKNGSGKTLLLKLLAGQIRLNPVLPLGPAVYAKSTIVKNELGSFASSRKQGLSVFLPAEPFRWITEESIRAELELYNNGLDLERRLRILEQCGLSDHRNPRYLSYGQQKLLTILALPDRCDLVCLDEPFADMGLAYIELIEGFVSEQISKSKWSAVLLSHSSDVELKETIL